MTTQLFTNSLLPSTSEQAIRQFRENFIMGVGAIPATGWARAYGEVDDVTAPRITYPISIGSTKYRETQDDTGQAKSSEEKSFDLKVVEYDDGHAAPLLDLFTNVFAYRRWDNKPQEFLMAAERLLNRSIVTLLEAGTSGNSPWDDVAFFSASHLANPKGFNATTFSNYQSSTLAPETIANIQAEMTNMRDVRDENGDKLGVEPDTILLPTAKFQLVSDALSQAYISNGTNTVSNPIMGKLKPIHLPELTDVNDWYLVDSKLAKGGLAPWVGARYLVPDTLGLRFWDENSDFFKNTSKIKVSSHIWWGFGMAFPHAIRLVKGA